MLSPMVQHTLRTVAAALLALGLAYLFELETPYSAATTVLIVSSPMHGMILSKSLYRLGGTLIGAVMALLLIALFAQSPEMFFLGLSLWMAACTIASTLLRGFRSYGAVLAGYTVVLITMPGIDTPNLIFDLAVSRVSVVGLGIMCSALVASVTTGRKAEETLDGRVRATLRKLSTYARQSLEETPFEQLTKQRQALAGDITALDAMVEFAAIEVAVGMTDLSDTLRGTAMGMFGVLTAAASAHGALERIESSQLPEGCREALCAILRRMEEAATIEDWQSCRQDLHDLSLRMESLIQGSDLNVITAIDRLAELAGEVRFCLDGALTLAGAASEKLPVRKVRPWRHRDFNWAAINGLRACLVIWMGGVLWTFSAWPSGSTMIAMIVPNIGLLAMRDHPVNDAVMFVWGTVAASVVGFAYLTLVLPYVTDFPLLALVLFVPLFVGVKLSLSPKTAFIAIGFFVFFITLVMPTNPMVYSPEVYLNNALATVGGAMLTAVFYRLVLPIDPKRHVRALVRAIQGDLQSLLRSGVSSIESWENRMHERLTQLAVRMRTNGMRQDHLLRGGFAALRMGREVMRIQDLLVNDAEARTQCADARKAMENVAQDPRAALHACRLAAEALTVLAAERPEGQSTAPIRAAASLFEISVLLGRHRRFFHRMPA